MVTAWNQKMIDSWQESYYKPRQCVKKQRHHFADEVLYSQGYGLSSSHVQMWELDHKEGWALKIWYCQTVVLEKTLECLFDCKEFTPVNPKGNQPWIFIGRTHAEAEAPMLWSNDVKSRFIEKDSDVGKDWRQEKWAGEDEMVRQHYWLSRAPLVAKSLKCLSGILEIQVRSLSWEDPLEKGMATHSSTLAWRVPWSEEPGAR